MLKEKTYKSGWGDNMIIDRTVFQQQNIQLAVSKNAFGN